MKYASHIRLFPSLPSISHTAPLMKSLCCLVLIAALWISSLTPAAAFTPIIDPQFPYLEVQLFPPQLLPPPPDEGSSAWRKQIAGVLEAQRAIPAADLTAMREEQRLRVELMTSTIGPNFTRERLPKTFLLLDRVFKDANMVTENDKKFWHTRRPYIADSHVKLYVDPIDDSPSYPSGHTTDMRVLAEVLGLLFPEKLADLRARAEAIAHHRVEAGVHYPGDLEGGRILAMIIVGALISNDDFQDDLEAVRKEIATK